MEIHRVLDPGQIASAIGTRLQWSVFGEHCYLSGRETTTMIHDVVKAEYLDGYRIKVSFDDGYTGDAVFQSDRRAVAGLDGGGGTEVTAVDIIDRPAKRGAPAS